MFKGPWTLRNSPAFFVGIVFRQCESFADPLKGPRTFEGHTDSVESVAISNDGKQILSGKLATRVKMWHIETGEIIHTFKGPYRFCDVRQFFA
ncbi:hypothetical protein BGS_0142 [Beggiatoa sp. SS]|nr:hypothetical protein BGS_0142 [Beggiatoa sp. SS]